MLCKVISANMSRLQEMNGLLHILAMQARNSIAAGPFNSHLRLLKRIASAVDWTGGTLLYPAGGFDAWTAFTIHPQAHTVLVIGREGFGSVAGIQRCLEALYMSAQEAPEIFDTVACQYNYDAEKSFKTQNLNGGYALFKLAAYTQSYPVSITRTKAYGLPLTKLEFKDGAGRSKNLWHIQTDLGLENPALQELFSSLDCGGVLLKAALDITNPAQDGVGFYKNILSLAKQLDCPLVMDRPLNQAKYNFFKETTAFQQVRLDGLNTFGYLQGHHDAVSIAKGRDILDYEGFLGHSRRLLPRFAGANWN